MKKYFVTDEESGEKYEIEEVTEGEVTEEPEVKDDAFSPEEIEALKTLAPVVDKLLKLLEIETEAHEDLSDEEEEETEEVVDTCHDSKRSIGALEKGKAIIDDSLTDTVADAWAKRYGGK